MPTATVEDYLKQILLLEQSGDDAPVGMGRLAEAAQVAPGSATAMIKRLAARRLVSYEPYAGVRLTGEGRRLALDVLRRHRLLETFLVEVLGLDWSEVHEEAERLEHAVSDRLLAAIDRVLGAPTLDPHGDPIPTAEGELAPLRLVPLPRCPAGETRTIRRVLDQSGEFLRFADRHGLRPGEAVEVLAHDEAAETMRVRVVASGEEVVVGARAAANVLLGGREAD